MSNPLLSIVGALLMAMPRHDGIRASVGDDLKATFVGEHGFEDVLNSPLTMGSVGEYCKEVERISARYQEHLWDVLDRERKHA